MYSANRSDVSWRKLENEAILIHLETNYYYSLNSTGTMVWEKLLKTERDVDGVVDDILGQYEGQPGEVRKDIQKLLKQLSREKLIITKTGPKAGARVEKKKAAKRSRTPYLAPSLTKFDKLEKLLICGE